MAKSEGDGESVKLDGLEIISIGSMHQGAWDKKYWSSSRGKDRFPYPVGYKAIRANEGITYKMEIKEGHKGPLFSITYNDGFSCSGESPDRAWEDFQKNGFSQTKIWHGKKVSGTIDGVEFFGFKNPLVQRLLRELMANINGAVENSLLVSGSRSKTSKTKAVKKLHEACNPDLLPLLVRPVTKKKQKGRSETKCKELRSGNGEDNTKQKKMLFEDKRTCSAMPIEGRALSTLKGQDMNDSDLCAPDTLDYMQDAAEGSTCQLKEEITAMDMAVAEGSVAEPQLKEVAVSNLLDTSSETKCKEFRSGNGKDNTKQKILLFEDKRTCSAMPIDSRALSTLKGQDMNDSDLCAPDTLDFMQDAADGSTCQLKEEITVMDMAVAEGFVAEPQLKEVAVSNLLDTSSEENTSYSVGQGISRSMMSILLPQAVPLLKKASRIKNIESNALETANNCSAGVPVPGTVNSFIFNVYC